MNKNVLVACATVCSIAAPPVLAEPLVRLHTSYYYVDGPSATVLAAQIDQNGPSGTDGKRYAGRPSGTCSGSSSTNSMESLAK